MPSRNGLIGKTESTNGTTIETYSRQIINRRAKQYLSQFALLFVALLFCCNSPCLFSQAPARPKEHSSVLEDTSERIPPGAMRSKPSQSLNEKTQSKEGEANSAKETRLIQDGVIAFKQYCIKCHDAQRSLQEDKSLAEWRDTVKEMAALEDAKIPTGKHESIATYLASLGTGENSKEKSKVDKTAENGKKPSKEDGKADAKLDPALVQQGKTAFTSYCVSCHDAEKSLQVSRSLAGWRSTVVRMAGKDGADIPQSSHEAISTYLASLATGDKSGESASTDLASSLSITGTVSPWFRGGGSSNIEFPGFFGDVWVGASLQNKSPVSVRATACNSCHNQGSQIGRFDLLEATVRVDLAKLWNNSTLCPCPVQASVQAGRFVVPFGAYYQQSNPGVDRAVTRPLIYNMGQRVYQNELGTQVLPMPYSDEGASMNFVVPIGSEVTSTIDAYVVNGLEGSTNGIDFYASRDYVDNNRSPSLGGRFTIGDKRLRLGASLIGGRFNSDAGTGPFNQGMNYSIFGLDATFRWEDLWRIQAEFAQRDSDRFGNLPVGPTIFQERYSGGYLQTEYLISKRRHISLFGRYDTQLTHSALPPLGSPLPTGDFRVERLTFGVNWTLPGGSLLMTDLEHWRVPNTFQDVNLLGIRWAATF
jgi:cytochrome c553